MDEFSEQVNWKWCTGCNKLLHSDAFSKLASGCDRKVCNRHLKNHEKKNRRTKFDEYSTLLSDIHSWCEEVRNRVFQIPKIAGRPVLILIFIWLIVDIRNEIECSPGFRYRHSALRLSR